MINPIVVEGGVAGSIFRSVDWYQSPLGPCESWPETLKTALRNLFHHPQPRLLFWGPQSNVFYNDALLSRVSDLDKSQPMGMPAKSIDFIDWPVVSSSNLFFEAKTNLLKMFGDAGPELTLSRKLACTIRGDLEVVNCQPEQSHIFVVSFKSFFTTHSSPHQDEIFETASGDQKLKGLKLLVVEDSADNQALLERILSKNGALVDLANDGQEGIQKALNGNYDIILMDIQMPVLDGYEAIAALKKFGLETPVFALTAHAMMEDKIKTSNAGFTGHLSKPLQSKNLIETLIHTLK